MLNLQLLPGAIAEILAATTDTQTLTLSDRYGLMAAVMDENLSEEEHRAITRLLHAIKRGKIQVLA